MSDNTLFKTALTKAMNLCSHREMSASEIESKLESWGISGSDTGKIISLLVKENFINEERYACAFARDRFKYNKWGKIKIAAHLRAKRISSAAISAGLQSINNNLYFSTLKALIESHRRSVKAKNQYELKAKLIRYGLSKGFESNVLYDILNANEE
jgi:regulatory protein